VLRRRNENQGSQGASILGLIAYLSLVTLSFQQLPRIRQP
jgi:hypothetical protein